MKTLSRRQANANETANGLQKRSADSLREWETYIAKIINKLSQLVLRKSYKLFYIVLVMETFVEAFKIRLF